jgi:hypothetical protein
MSRTERLSDREPEPSVPRERALAGLRRALEAHIPEEE